jgi:hypothetical protein
MWLSMSAEPDSMEEHPFHKCMATTADMSSRGFQEAAPPLSELLN